MKNFIIVALVVLLPIFAYITLDSKKHSDIISVAEAGDKPVVMVFTSTMCSDCQKLKKVLAVVEPNYKDKIDFIKINAVSDDSKAKDLVKKHKVLLVPTCVFIDKKGVQKYRTEGSMSKDDFESKLKVILND